MTSLKHKKLQIVQNTKRDLPLDFWERVGQIFKKLKSTAIFQMPFS